MGNGVKVPVVATGTFRLFLDTHCCIDLFQTLYIPSISRNLVSMSKLDLEGYFFSFRNRRFSLFKNSSFFGSGSLCDGLYKLNLNSCFAESLLTLHHNVGAKCNLINESFSYLWHRRLGHISKERMKRLVKDGILSNLDFTDLDVCVDCIKGNKPNIQRRVLQEVENFLKSSIQTFVGRLALHLLVKKNILSLSLMIFHVIVIFIYCMKNLKQWMP